MSALMPWLTSRTEIKARFASIVAAVMMLSALVLPLSSTAAEGLTGRPVALSAILIAALMVVVAGRYGALSGILLGLAGVIFAGGATLMLLRAPDVAGNAASGFWVVVIAVWLAAGIALTRLSSLKTTTATAHQTVSLAIPLLFGAVLFYLWEVAVRGFGVPSVLMPAPSAVAARFAVSLPTLGEDFVQTFVRGVLSGYVIGCSAGFLTAIVADRFSFLERGLLPLGNFISALPVVGIAPIMVMWFGFDWPSKAAVVAIITFFPMLVNTLAGLEAAGRVERDLMRSYAAGPAQTLVKLTLPAALPFIFNALKINSTLALIGAIVAEFFGTPIRGMGFRISIEVARMSLDMVWAEITLAALAGMAFYGLIALTERATTSWHPVYRT